MPRRLLFLRDVRRAALRSIPFTSTCPKCRVQRSQYGQSFALKRLLDRGHPIEAFCEVCDEYWAIHPRERSEIARGIAPELIP